ncbi:MAG TPA: hypothetical protein VLE03_06605 [Nitrospiraceae bacterium]|nr:hypothetical protein [Nitrospiraceae bacterium]
MIRTGTPSAIDVCRSTLLIGLVLLVFDAPQLQAQEAILEWFPIRPYNFDFALRQQSFAPNDREIGIQAGITALRYGDLEVRATYQFFSIHTDEFKTDQNSVFLNPRWNNFIDILDFPRGMPINRVIRHVLFGPLEDRAVPYLGLLGGVVFSGTVGGLYGGQLGVRFPVARGLSVDFGVQYSRMRLEAQGQQGEAEQWVLLTGFRY